jgi:uncharacterized glyoxalase superfamily protein PhnB
MTHMSYKPNTYNSASPYLIVEGAQASMAFLSKVFNAEKLREMLNPNGTVMHAEMRIDDTVVMLSDQTEGWPAVPAHVHIYVRDVDEAYRKALDAGAVSIQAPVQKDDPDRRCGVKDAGGTTWWISTQVG